MNKFFYYKQQRNGFSIIESVMVLSLVAILLSLAIVLVNPVEHVSDARNAERWNNVNRISNALSRYKDGNGGTLPSSIDHAEKEICKMEREQSACVANGLLDLHFLISGSFPVIPADPMSKSSMGTGYTVMLGPQNNIVVSASLAEGGDVVSVSR